MGGRKLTAEDVRTRALEKRIGRRVVVAISDEIDGYSTMLLSRCDCGTEQWLSMLTFLYSKGDSCGCRRREVTELRSVTHGHSRVGAETGTHRSWRAMIRRCTKPKATDFAFYGGRGIRVCERWMSFQNFLDDMGERPPGMTIDRENSNGDYTPANCRWTTRPNQSRNRRDTVWEAHEPAQVRWLSSLGYRQIDIAKFFDTTQGQISAIVVGRSWAVRS